MAFGRKRGGDSHVSGRFFTAWIACATILLHLALDALGDSLRRIVLPGLDDQPDRQLVLTHRDVDRKISDLAGLQILQARQQIKLFALIVAQGQRVPAGAHDEIRVLAQHMMEPLATGIDPISDHDLARAEAMPHQGFCAMAIRQGKPAEPMAKLVAAVQDLIGACAAEPADRGPVKQYQIAGFCYKLA